MFRSIRSRLQLWYALVLLAVVGGFAGLLYQRVAAARLQSVDAELETATLYLEANLRRFPPNELGGPQPEPPRPPGSPGPPHFDRDDKERPRRPPPGGGPPRPSRERLLADVHLPKDADGTGGTYFFVWLADDSLLSSGGAATDAPAPSQAETPAGQPRITQRGDVREAIMRGPGRTRILVGRSVQPELAELHTFAGQLIGVGVVVLAVGLTGGWLMSARLLRPLAAISATASAISATNLSKRIPPETVDRELTELAGVLNAMFDRLEASFERQARFTADASHELRTPLAIIRTHAELSLSRPRAAEDYRKTIETCLTAAGRMTALVEGLLTLARADAGKLDLVRKPVDLRHVVEESVGLLQPLAAGKGVAFAADLDAVEVAGDGNRLAQVVVNLLNNAVQYNRPGGAVRVALHRENGAALLSVTDTGCGVPEEDRLHLFERFYRVDKARSRASGGNGLGLAICKSIVEVHGGAIGFTTQLNEGSTFWVRLPACAN